MAPRIYSIY